MHSGLTTDRSGWCERSRLQKALTRFVKLATTMSVGSVRLFFCAAVERRELISERHSSEADVRASIRIPQDGGVRIGFASSSGSLALEAFCSS